MPRHTTKEVEVKPDLHTIEFSPQNAFFFATLSKVAYKNQKEAKGLVVGNSTYEGMGFEHFYWFQGGKNASKCMFDAIQDTEAFVAANDDMIAVVFRGTKGAEDWATNLKFFQTWWPKESDEGGIHKGFDEGVSTVWGPAKGMRDTVKKLYHEVGKNRKLFVAGHSLGGALATIAAARLCSKETMNVHGIYTFGSPRVFNNEKAHLFDNSTNGDGAKLKNKYFRCRNNNDIVTRVPFTPYTHVGTEIYLNRFGQLSTNNLSDRLLGRLNACLQGYFADGIHDHLISEYARYFKKMINSSVPVIKKVANVVNDAEDNLALKVHLVVDEMQRGVRDRFTVTPNVTATLVYRVQVAPNAAANSKEGNTRTKTIEEVKDQAKADAGGL